MKRQTDRDKSTETQRQTYRQRQKWRDTEIETERQRQIQGTIWPSPEDFIDEIHKSLFANTALAMSQDAKNHFWYKFRILKKSKDLSWACFLVPAVSVLGRWGGGGRKRIINLRPNLGFYRARPSLSLKIKDILLLKIIFTEQKRALGLWCSNYIACDLGDHHTPWTHCSNERKWNRACI